MIRTLIPSILLFFLPFALYFLWLGFQRRRVAEEAIDKRKHFFWIGVAGLVLAVAGFVFFTDFGGATPDEVYVPPTYVDGKLVPGHFAPRTPAP
jgi:4-amino-4-deoxy-L-arabinose transferase-like glycosyltransferase